jgi:serine/threonine protein kinase
MSLEGTRLGHYQLLRRVGTGGMGEVYLADDTRLTRQVALKVLRIKEETGSSTGHQDAVRLSLRELRTIAMLDHPHILPLYDYGEEEADGKKIAFLVMPFRDEGTLKDWLKRAQAEGTLSAYTVAAMIAQAASALQYAHDRGIIHQDVKPSNFLIRSNPNRPQRPDLLLTDFVMGRVSGNLLGTPIYQAPEQLEGLVVPATDQYALGVMAYEMLTRRPPFQGSLVELRLAHLQKPAPPPSRYKPWLSEEIDKAILRALAKRPEDRFPSIAAFAAALEAVFQPNPFHPSESTWGSRPPDLFQKLGPQQPAQQQGFPSTPDEQVQGSSSTPYPQPQYSPSTPEAYPISIPDFSEATHPRGVMSKVADWLFRGWGKRQQKQDLSLYAVARTTLEADELAMVGKTYWAYAGIAQQQIEHFRSEPFKVTQHDPTQILVFGILVHPSENIEHLRDAYQHLIYRPGFDRPQLVSIPFRVRTAGSCSLLISFYREQQWLKTIKFEFESIEQSASSAVAQGG